MNSFHNKPITDTELRVWVENKQYNPRTKRKIKIDGRLYKYIEKMFNTNILSIDLTVLDSNDHRDPISLKPFYKLNSDGTKKIIYKDLSNLIIYRESEQIVRCFEKESLEYMKSYDITNHPISSKEIPSEIFDKIKRKSIDVKLTSEEKALQVFQMFTHISIFIDYKLFCNLDKDNLLKFNYETKDFYYKNFSITDRKRIDGENGDTYFKFSNSEIKDYEDEKLKLYLLDQIQLVLTCKEEDLKFMINYIVLGGLSLVIEEVKKYYENFNFSF